MPKALVLGGATGLLGQALVTVLRGRGWETESLGRSDGDLLNIGFLRERVERADPDVVFNAVAWTRVDDAEDHAEEAIALNRALPDALARIIASREKTRLAHFSTDFVFSGNNNNVAWRETDEPRPLNVYGASKLEGERAVLEILPERAFIARTAWLFGPGRVDFVDKILLACQNRDIVSVVEDQVGSPTFSLDLAEWSAMLAEKGATGLWHAVNSGRASWCELATEATQLMSAPCRVVPINSEQWTQKAKRPANSVLANDKLANFLGIKPRPWPRALRDYLYGDYFKTNREGKKA